MMIESNFLSKNKLKNAEQKEIPFGQKNDDGDMNG